jgi:hypothetical protein
MTQQQTEILAYCSNALEQVLQFNHTLFCLAGWAFVLALLLAVASTALDLWIKWKAARAAQDVAAVEGDVNLKGILPVTADMIKILTSFVESLAKLPVWFALFVAGMALVWLTTVDVPSVCEPVAAADTVTAPPIVKKDANGPAPATAPASK